MAFDGTKTALLFRKILSGILLVVRFLRNCFGAGQITSAEEAIVLGETSDGRVVTWPALADARECSHAVMFGGSAAGKTTVGIHVTASEIRRARALPPELRPSFFLLDPKQDHAEGLLQAVAGEMPEEFDNVHWLDVFARGGGVPLNFCLRGRSDVSDDQFALDLAQLVADTSGVAGDQRALGAGPNQIAAWATVFRALLSSDHPDRSPLWAYQAFALKDGFQRLASLSRSRDARDALLALRLSEDRAASCLLRLQSAFLAEDVSRCLGASSCIDMAKLLGPGQITCVSAASARLSLQKLFGSLIGRLAVNHLLARPCPFVGHSVRVLLEEVHLVAGSIADVADVLLTTGRARAVGVTCISQGTILIDEAAPTLLAVLLGNAKTKIVGRLAAADALLFSREISPSSGVEDAIRDVQEEFAVMAANLRPREFFKLSAGERQRFRSLEIDTARWEKAAEEQAARIAAVKARYRVPPSGRRLTLAEATNSNHVPTTPIASPWG